MISKLLLSLLFQYWLKKAKQIRCLTPLPEEPVIPRLAKMLEPEPYKAPEKKATGKAKGVRSGPRRKGTLDVTSKDAETHSPTATDDEEVEERNSPPEGGRKKRAASTHLEAEASKKGKACTTDNSAWEIDSNFEWRPRDKPLAES